MNDFDRFLTAQKEELDLIFTFKKKKMYFTKNFFKYHSKMPFKVKS